MALINKIRENTGLTLVVLGVALASFIIGDYLSGGGGSSLGSAANNKVGSINGEDVDMSQFNSLVENQRLQYESQAGRAANEQEMTSIRNQVWEQLIQEKAYEPQYEELGIGVSADELKEMIQGVKNMHPYVRQQFSDPQTGMFNAESHRQFITSVANKTLPQQQQVAWDQFKASLIQIRKAEKYQKLIGGANYITKAETKKEYKDQNDRISANYMFVPFYSIVDSTIKVSDGEISDYYSKHKAEYDGYDSRTLEYVVFQIAPSKEDSAGVRSEINSLAKGLAAATNALAYANANSDIKTSGLRTKSELSPEISNAISQGLVGSIIGPFKDGNNYSIFKYEGTETDSLYTVAASHILINSAATDPDSVRAAARTKALGILAQLKSGSDFATLARINSQDKSSAQNGGDLGYFQNNGKMIKPFENAIFGFSGVGLIPNLVETDYGFHIIKVNEAKSNIKYKLSTITKVLLPSEVTRNEFFTKAEDFKKGIATIEDLKSKVKENDDVVLFTANGVAPGARTINSIDNASSIVNWAYDESTSLNDVSDKIFEVDDNLIIAGVSGVSDQENPIASDFKSQIEVKIRNEKKGEQIMKKLGKATGTLEAIAQGYGAGALVESVADINFQTGMLSSPGLDQIAIGTAFGLKPGKRKGPFVGDNGVFVMETSARTDAPEIADYSVFKESIQSRKGPDSNVQAVYQALRDAAKITDRRARMF